VFAAVVGEGAVANAAAAVVPTSLIDAADNAPNALCRMTICQRLDQHVQASGIRHRRRHKLSTILLCIVRGALSICQNTTLRATHKKLRYRRGTARCVVSINCIPTTYCGEIF